VLPISTALRDSATSPTQRMVKGQNVERLGRAMHELPAPLRRILELVYWQELDVPAVARRLGMPLNTAYSHLHRARLALRSALHDSLASAPARAAR
jgi:RNA polymerase sigma factor (sigma-70 family)